MESAAAEYLHRRSGAASLSNTSHVASVAWCAAPPRGRSFFRGKFVRVNVYVDGFNLYHRALRNTRAPDGSTYKWLDLEKLAAQILSNPAYTIRRVRYFTARVRALPGDPQAPLRQQMYLRALATLSSVTVHFGFFQKSQKKMQLVKPLPDGTTMVKVHKFEEKGSDVTWRHTSCSTHSRTNTTPPRW